MKINTYHWNIDSGTGINLTNELNDLKYKNDINNKNIIYPNGKLDKIKCKGTYNGKFKNNKFIVSNVYYASNIKNNIISTHSILKNGCKIITENINNEDRLKIIKNNKLIANIYADGENLFSLDTIPINNVTSKNHVLHMDNVLWHLRLGH